MKKIASIIACLVLAITTLTSCEQAGGTIATGGSTSVEAVIQSMMEVYMEENPGVTITYAPTGSSTGVQGAADATLDIGLSSRGLKDEEKATLTETVFALDGIAIIVNGSNTVADLDMASLASIYKGEITNWSEVGGSDAEIVVIGRDSASGTRDGFESIVEVEDVCVYDEEQASGGGVKASVQSIEGAIGYVSISSVSDEVNVVSIDGVAPSEEAVKDGSYQIQRPFVFATLTGEENETVAAFMEWALSEATVELVRDAGAVPIS